MARTFDGDAANYLELPSIGPGSGGTMAAWFKTSGFSADGEVLVGQWDNDFPGPSGRWFMSVNPTGKVETCVNYGSGFGMCTTGATALTTDEWQHCAVTYTSTVLKVYLNGVEDGSSTGGTQNLLTGGSVICAIGRDWSGGLNNRPASGDIGEVTVWNDPISAEEIAALAAGVNAMRIRPQKINGHWPLYGLGGGGDEFAFNNGDYYATEQGTLAVAADHPPVGRPFETSQCPWGVTDAWIPHIYRLVYS